MTTPQPYTASTHPALSQRHLAIVLDRLDTIDDPDFHMSRAAEHYSASQAAAEIWPEDDTLVDDDLFDDDDEDIDLAL